MCHYKRGNKNEITLVFSCPGQAEKIKGEPAAGQTGKNLNELLKLLNIGKLSSYSLLRDDITITNATKKVEYYSKTQRSEASLEEVLKKSTINRLYKEIKQTNNVIICFGNNAKIAVDEVINKYSKDFVGIKRANVVHLSMKSINFSIKEDINNNKIIKGQKGNTKKRLQVIANHIESQL